MGTNYYVSRPACKTPCDHCTEGREEIHLGKSSSGWEFTFRGQSEFSPGSYLDDWITLALSGDIKDEYGTEVPFSQLWYRIMMAQSGQVPNGYENQGHTFIESDFS